MTTQDEQEPSYIDYETFLSPDFNPASFANTLVLATNNPNDAPLDLSTPLSRVLFDTQEIDSHIDVLTTKSAAPLLQYTDEQNAASKRIIGELDAQIKSLNDSYRQLEKEVIDKHAEAEEVRQVATRLWETLKLGRSVGRCLQLGRQLEVQHAEIASGSVSAAAAAAGKKEDHRALVRCSHTLLSLREVLDRSAPGEEGYGLGKVDAIRTLREGVIAPIERSVRETAEKIIRDFAIPNSATFAQGEETKARTVSAMVTLFLLSPQPAMKGERWTPTLLLQALEVYFRSALQSSIASLSRALGQLPSLDRTLAEISARCQNIVALEVVLESTKLPTHPLVTTPQKQTNMLQPLLAYLETGSLASYFWRTMAGSLGTRVQEIVNRGGVSARTLRTNRASVGEAVRECVVRGCEMPSALKGKGRGEGNWEREVAVMVGSVVNNLGR
ncbi:Conserved oligomeric Golgi complex subunit 5 [Colletotrichum siamense]|uniref:Conserved oligomeric Golgi complex subunit 5 n=1 Tax=Colletotrichum siamense TaxID=690259 RepID=A0A9P5F074_COLSI|nr:Conserved oligomeric Golgi complex subunit 5 [Colletotrichum siamense]KAI8192260.1 Conserved oligomeric Golgi complex subunit 5 [Colletotrichum sp. SAR 10_75]KAI8229304.1 Conserved oligomeric Golgi complex subunit 5 [Colletotrichum sp. SAR 10_77]KAJ5014980.1 Conserved oligomeric Golgi complex subunit 5 [Colletotrichum sp. SAR 10_99]KAF4864363.1 Conserved oligomeric Golgi complex subunit 5 [Colletotrichum siamense]